MKVNDLQGVMRFCVRDGKGSKACEAPSEAKP